MNTTHCAAALNGQRTALKRKTPARSTEISRPAANLNGQGLKTTAGGCGCGGGDVVVSRNADRMEVPPTTH